MEQILIKDRKYEGKYVALRDLKDPSPIASGDDARKVFETAVNLGTASPLLVYVPLHGMVQIY